jgi:hypothetical protein
MWNALVRSMKKRGWYFVHALTGVHLSTLTHYLDWSMMSASFLAPVAKVKEKLPSEKLNPVQSAPGITTVVFRAMEVRQVRGLPPYNEFSIDVPVVYEVGGKAAGLPGSYILYMPVTSEEARWGGVEVGGFPKFLAEIKFEDVGEVRRCQVHAEGKGIITLEVKKFVAEPQSWDWYLYGVRDGRILRTLVQIQGQRGLSDVREGASYTLGDHPIAEELRSLEIGNISITHEYAPKLRSLENNPMSIS